MPSKGSQLEEKYLKRFSYTRRDSNGILYNITLATKIVLGGSTNSDSLLKLFLWLVFVAFVTIIIHKGLPQKTLPLCQTHTEVPLLRTLSACSWQEGRHEHTPCPRLAILGGLYKINGLLILLPHLSPISDLERTWHPSPSKMIILRHLFAIFSVSWLSE